MSAKKDTRIFPIWAKNSKSSAACAALRLYATLITASSVFLSALLQAFTIRAFVTPANLLSSGFTGLAILIDRITSLVGFSFPTFVGMLALNIPVAAICWRSINRRFVLFSMAQVFLSSFFLRTFTDMHILPPFHNILLEVVFRRILLRPLHRARPQGRSFHGRHRLYLADGLQPHRHSTWG